MILDKKQASGRAKVKGKGGTPASVQKNMQKSTSHGKAEHVRRMREVRNQELLRKMSFL